MGWWKLEAWKLKLTDDKHLEQTELSESDLEHIAEMIKQGYTEGEITDEGE